MDAMTPRRSSRVALKHTPKMSDRKKGLFQCDMDAPRESLTTHRNLPVVNSESDSDDCDLGIISALDSSSCDEYDSNTPKTPERRIWHDTRSQKLLRGNNDLKNFIKSPFTLKKFQTRYSNPEKCSGSISTPATPHFQHHPVTPSSTHSCASAHTVSSTSSKARKSLASLIADTESCSSSLKDLNFDTDSGTDSKENTPTKSVRRSSRKQKLTPKYRSFKGILLEQKKNVSPMKVPMVCLTRMDKSEVSPTQMLRTPNTTTEVVVSPPKLQNRRPVVEIAESPESATEDEKSHKRLRNDSMSEAPSCKLPRLDVPKARLSLFSSDRLKEILSAKCFYGKSNPELTTNITRKISHVIEATASHHRRPFSHSNDRRKRKPGAINMGVRHKIRKPKHNKAKNINIKLSNSASSGNSFNNTIMSVSMNNSSVLSQNSSQELANDKADPFDKEKQTIEALLSQWTEEEVPESELTYVRQREEIPCFNSTVMQETNEIFQPITAVPVQADLPTDDAVIVQLGAQNEVQKSSDVITPQTTMQVNNTTAQIQGDGTVQVATEQTEAMAQDVIMMEQEAHIDNHGEIPKEGQFLPVEGGYIYVEENQTAAQEELPDLDEIERELKMLDEQILEMAQSNNINPEAVLKSTESVYPSVTNDIQSTSTASLESPKKNMDPKLFPIFSKPNPGSSTPKSKAERSSKKTLLKTASDQYVIDAGQKRFGATQCTECDAIYQIGDPQDEHDHLVHHNATHVLRFNGWKEECVVGNYGTARCIRVRGGEPGWKKVENLLSRVVHPQLGYEGSLPRNNVYSYTGYLYIEKKQIIGCLIIEPKVRAFKLIPGEPDCCSIEAYPVKCGVSRLWTHINHRRKGIATRLIECARASFLYGDTLSVSDISFSSPTTVGKIFATRYCGTENFYVYLD